MRRFKSGWVLVVVALLAIGMAIANSSRDVRWRKLSDTGRRDPNEGRREEAEAKFRAALGVAQSSDQGDPRLPESDLNQADSVNVQGRSSEAERLSKRALSIKVKSLVANQPETAAILKQLAPRLRESGQAAPVENPKTRKEPIRIKTH